MSVETQELSKSFGRHAAVRGVSLRVPAGAAFALIGANGAGKTTALRMLVNIIAPDSGTARVLGIDSRTLARRDYTRIGYVSENQKLPERLTVEQYFDYLRALYENWDRGLEQTLRRELELPPDRRLGKLSHGMRMKTLLASVLSFRPELLILDEPLSGLDPLVRDQMVEGLLRQADGTTIVISSHEITEIETFVTHIGYMEHGQLLFHDSTESLLARFREVHVTLSGNAPSSAEYPPSWLNAERVERSLRFVDSAFASYDGVLQSLTRRFGPVRFEAEPMSLRDVTKSLMRARRPAALS